jgi:hypothetical protein
VSRARHFWQRIETLHAVTYFAPESRAAAKEAGLLGFWMGYFGFRAAPLGQASAGAVRASFANFALPMIQRSIPAAWDHCDPADLIAVRSDAAAAALRRLSPDLDDHAATRLARTLREVVEVGDPLGRPLFSANMCLPPHDDPVQELWQHCTTLREHRGDGHVMALALEDIDGCEAHRLHAVHRGVPDEVLRDNRGFSHDEWAQAGQRLSARGLVDSGRLTGRGREMIERIESQTDRLAGVPFDRVLDDEAQWRLIDDLDALARPVARSGVLPFPNPMGLPAFDEEDQASR